MEEGVTIFDSDLRSIKTTGLCGYKDPKKEGFPEKERWLAHQMPKGLRIKTLWVEGEGAQGMIEYTPGEQVWRPVKAPDTLFIHCLFVGFKKEFKGKGFATLLIEAVIEEARKEGKSAVAVVTRKGSFMVDTPIFEKRGFRVVDQAAPDFKLLHLPLKETSPLPVFNHKAMAHSLQKFNHGIFILRSDQCPYTVKNVREMCERAEKTFKITPFVMTLCSPLDAQVCPSPFGTFCVIMDGEIVAHHPISATRFLNILHQQLGSPT